MTSLFVHIPESIQIAYGRLSGGTLSNIRTWRGLFEAFFTNIECDYISKESSMVYKDTLRFFFDVLGNAAEDRKLPSEVLAVLNEPGDKIDKYVQNERILNHVLTYVKEHGYAKYTFDELLDVYKAVKVLGVSERKKNPILVGAITELITAIRKSPANRSQLIGEFTKVYTHFSTVRDLDDPNLLDVMSNIYSNHRSEFEQDRPRPLTESEIVEILSKFPEPKHSIRRIREHMHKQRLNDVRRMLKSLVLSPSRLEQFIELIIRDYRDATIANFSAVGMAAAEAMGGPITQMALNSFHSSGAQKSVTKGFELFEEIFRARKNLKNPSMHIKFRNPIMTFDNVMDKRKDVVNVKMSSLIKEIKIMDAAEIAAEPPWWYELHELISDQEINPGKGSHLLRITFDGAELYAYNIMMSMIETAVNRLYSSDLISMVSAPDGVNVLDIYVNPDAIPSSIKVDHLIDIDQDFMTHDKFVLSTVMYSQIQDITIGGVPNIKNLDPSRGVNVTSLILREELVGKDSYRVVLNDKILHAYGVSIELPKLFCTIAGYHVEDETSISFLATPLVTKEVAAKPSELMNKLASKNREDEDMYEETMKSRGVKTFRRTNPTLAGLVSVVTHGDTTGVNMGKILKRSDVDPNYTYSSNMHDILRYFGIGAARSFIVKSISEALRNAGNYVDARHYDLIAGYMTCLGFITAINFTGAYHHGYSVLSLAAQQSAYNVIGNAAVFGTDEQITSYTDHITYGQRMPRSVISDAKVDYATLPDMDIGMIDEAFGSVKFGHAEYAIAVQAGMMVADNASSDNNGVNLPAALIGSIFESKMTVDELFRPEISAIGSDVTITDLPELTVFVPTVAVRSHGAAARAKIMAKKLAPLGGRAQVELIAINPIARVIIAPLGLGDYSDVESW